jgi:hypothetical protein
MTERKKIAEITEDREGRVFVENDAEEIAVKTTEVPVSVQGHTRRVVREVPVRPHIRKRKVKP